MELVSPKADFAPISTPPQFSNDLQLYPLPSVEEELNIGNKTTYSLNIHVGVHGPQNER
jgi:hypothetical protein